MGFLRKCSMFQKDIKYFPRKLGLVEPFSENPELDTFDSSLVKN